MEEAAGTKLDDIWDELPLENKIAIMKDLVSIESKLLSVSFSRYRLPVYHRNRSGADTRLSYGNLYYSSEVIPGAAVAEVVSDASPEVKIEVNKRFSIGPVVERDFWSKEGSIMDIDRGPCTLSLDEYFFCLMFWIRLGLILSRETSTGIRVSSGVS